LGLFSPRTTKKGDIENSFRKFTHLTPYKKRKLKIKEKKGKMGLNGFFYLFYK